MRNARCKGGGVVVRGRRISKRAKRELSACCEVCSEVRSAKEFNWEGLVEEVYVRPRIEHHGEPRVRVQNNPIHDSHQDGERHHGGIENGVCGLQWR